MREDYKAAKKLADDAAKEAKKMEALLICPYLISLRLPKMPEVQCISDCWSCP